MDPFVFTTDVTSVSAPSGYVPMYVQPTNISTGINRTHVIGALTLAKVGGSDVGFYILRQNPFSLGVVPRMKGFLSGEWVDVDNWLPSVNLYAVLDADYQLFINSLTANKLLSASGNDSLLGLVVDAMCLDDYNWVVAISKDRSAEATLDISVQMIQQFYQAAEL